MKRRFMDQRLTQTPYKSLLIATDNLRRGLAQTKSWGRLLISVLIRLYTDDVGIGACTTLIVGS